MKTTTKGLIVIGALLWGGVALSQERYTEGPVWSCDEYQILPDMGDDYVDWLRANYLVGNEEAKKQGLILDSKVFFPSQRMATGSDIIICTLYPSYGKALDYNKGDDDKWKAITAKRLSTTDEKKQEEMIAPRLKMREYIGTVYLREVTLKPTP